MQILIKNKFNIINSSLIFLFIFLIALPFALIGGDALHDGLMLKVALDVYSGKMLFSQTYSYYGIISPVAHALSIQVFGEYLSSIRIATAIVYALSGLILFFLWSKFAGKWISLIALIFWVMVAPYYYQIFYPWPSVFAMFFQILTIFLYVLFLRHDRKLYLILIGISTCLTFFSKQSYALLFLSIFILEGIFVLIRINNFKKFFQNTFIVGLSFTCVFLIVIFWFYMNDALYDYWLQVIRQGYSVGKIVGGSFMHNFISYYSRHPFWLIIFSSTIIIFMNYVWKLYKKNGNVNLNKIIVSVAFLSFPSFAQIYPTVDPSHTYWAVAPGFIFIFFIMFSIIKYLDSSTKNRRIIIGIFLLILFTFVLIEPIYTLNKARMSLMDNYYEIEKPTVLTHMKIKNSDAKFYFEINKEMEEYLLKHPKKSFIIDNSDAIYSTFTKKTINVLPIFANFSGYSSGYYNFDEAINNYVIKNKPLVLVESVNVNRFKNYHTLRIWKKEKLALVAPDEN